MDANKKLQKHRKQIKFHVDSKYSILETIGAGAYGVVCSAVDNANGQRVAIKKISNVFDIPAITKRTLRELKILKHFKHDNIISIKEILRPPEDLSKFTDVYMVLDLMGSDLHHIVHSKQELSIEHIRYFLYQLLRGLKYIHSSNIIHRDLKPSNLLINKDCELKIGDFGMARSLSASPSEKKRVMTEYVATRWYRAPELMLSLHQFTKAIDIWSVGCIFAEMLGRTPLFPGSNYLNQLQLILSVVGVPNVEFMSTITSEKIRNYISRLPHKEAVSLSKLYPDASDITIDLLGTLLILDPKKRCSVENALKHPFLEKYHDLDDEPTSPLFAHDLESIPLERNILRHHILKEIQEYHTKRPKPKLAPVQTDFLKPFMLPGENSKNKVSNTLDASKNIVIQVDPKQDSRKRKHKPAESNPSLHTQVTKKKMMAVETDESNVTITTEAKELSNQDKEILERWQQMQKHSKPFVHPIRQHMDELQVLKSEATVIPSTVTTTSEETIKGQPIVDRVSGLQFTNFVAQNKDGLVSLVKEQTIRLPKQVKTEQNNQSITEQLKAQLQQSQPKQPHRQPQVQPQRQQRQQTILVPLASLPLFQMHNGPVVILPKFATSQKVNMPIPIAPKPPAKISPKPKSTVTTTTVVCIQPAIMKSRQPMIYTTTHVNQAGITNTNMLNSNNLYNLSSILATSNVNKDYNALQVRQDGSLNSGESVERKTIESAITISSDDSKSLVSASSILSDISINSSELNSSTISDHMVNSSGHVTDNKNLNEEKVLAELKRLDSQERNIVNLIENLSDYQNSNINQSDKTISQSNKPQNSVYLNSSQNTIFTISQPSQSNALHNQSSQSTALHNQSKHLNTFPSQSRESVNINQPKNSISTTNQSRSVDPVTTLASNDTNSWSIVKSMLVSALKIKKDKEEKSSILNVANQNKSKQNNISTTHIPPSFVSSMVSTQPPTVTNSEAFTKVRFATNLTQSQNFYQNDTSSTNTNLNVNYTSDASENKNRVTFMTSSTSLMTSSNLSSQPNGLNSQPNNLNSQPNNLNSQPNIVNSQTIGIASNNFINDFVMENKSPPHDVSLINSLALEFPNHPNYSSNKTNQNLLDQSSQDNISDYTNLLNKNNDGTFDVLLTPIINGSRNVLLTPRMSRTDDDLLLTNKAIDEFFTIKTESRPNLRVNTSQNKDVFLTTLVDTPKTPKSGAAAYGLGMNFEDLFVGSTFDLLNPIRQPNSSQISDQTPLSASLLSDWLGGNEIEPMDVVDLQRELETTSTSLMFEN